MRAGMFGSAVLAMAIAAPAPALAQQARNTPDGIVCAMTGSCGGAAEASADGRVAVGDERAFSLARPNAPATTTTTSRPSTAAPRRATASSRPAPRRAPVRPAAVVPGGGIDMQVTFRRGSAEMTPQARTEARASAQAMAAPQMQGMRFAIEGHTDSSGQRARNLELSQQRADAVADYLAQQGVDRSRLTTKGYGPDKPVRGRRASDPQNRRVEFVKAA